VFLAALHPPVQTTNRQVASGDRPSYFPRGPRASCSCLSRSGADAASLRTLADLAPLTWRSRQTPFVPRIERQQFAARKPPSRCRRLAVDGHGCPLCTDAGGVVGGASDNATPPSRVLNQDWARAGKRAGAGFERVPRRCRRVACKWDWPLNNRNRS
jgi:hypothetical protein